jgi:hypothetical protein
MRLVSNPGRKTHLSMQPDEGEGIGFIRLSDKLGYGGFGECDSEKRSRVMAGRF